jgi:hypothetical protein
MSRRFTVGACAAVSIAAVALLVSCKSNPTADAPSGQATTLDVTSVSTGITEMSSVIAVCRKTGSPAPTPVGARDDGTTSLLARALAMRTDPVVRIGLTRGRLTSTKPADQLGDCGGRITYPTYSHSSGTTTGTYQFDNYCTKDSDTGERTTLNGRISFTNVGTPSSSGPITNRVEASSSDGVTQVTRSSAGVQTSSQKTSFTDFVYAVGVPGGSPTSSKPDQLTIKDFSLVDQTNSKSYRQTNYSMTYFNTSSGGEQISISGRGYRSNGDYFDVSTTTPIVTNSSGSYTGGQLSFKGANNSTAVLTVVPGSTLQGTMTVNGQPVTSVPVCK